MIPATRYGTFRKVLVAVAWSVVVAGSVTLLVAAIRRQNKALCKGIRITIEGSGRWMVDSVELRDILTDQHTRILVGTPAEDISTRRLERKISASPWVRKAELFFDSKQVLWVKVTEREPIARLFTAGGESFYMDTSGVRLPLKDYFPVKLPVFTSCPLDDKVWTGQDTLLAREVGVLSQYLVSHPFWMDMVQEVDVTPEGEFELIPTIGDPMIRLGDTSALDSKFNRLMVFYRDVLPRVGWNKYADLDVRFARQVIGIKRDARTEAIDTAQAAALLRALIDQGRTAMRDTVVKTTVTPRNITPDIDSTLDLVPSDADQGGGMAPAIVPVPGPGRVTVPVHKTGVKQKSKPKAVMPPKKNKT
jgi:cell division protein FtsQ